MNPDSAPLASLAHPIVEDPPEAPYWTIWLWKAFLHMVAIGTSYYKELDEIERREFAEFVNDGDLLSVVEQLKINALNEANAFNLDLSIAVLSELSASSVRIGVPVPDSDRERLYAIMAELWAMFVRLSAIKARGVPAKPAKPTMMLTAGTGTPTVTSLPQHEEETPPTDPFIPLTSWNEILDALKEHHVDPHWKNDERIRTKIRKLNEQHTGPIRLPVGRGSQPTVAKAALLTWWNGLREHFDFRSVEEKAETESARLSVVDSHNYGTSGTVIPGIGGAMKQTRSKGKEGKR